jgi:hypothetical protein
MFCFVSPLPAKKGHGHSFENRSFKFLSKTGKQIDWGPQGFNY